MSHRSDRRIKLVGPNTPTRLLYGRRQLGSSFGAPLPSANNVETFKIEPLVGK
jgi:hypothetical protein